MNNSIDVILQNVIQRQLQIISIADTLIGISDQQHRAIQIGRIQKAAQDTQMFALGITGKLDSFKAGLAAISNHVMVENRETVDLPVGACYYHEDDILKLLNFD